MSTYWNYDKDEDLYYKDTFLGHLKRESKKDLRNDIDNFKRTFIEFFKTRWVVSLFVYLFIWILPLFINAIFCSYNKELEFMQHEGFLQMTLLCLCFTSLFFYIYVKSVIQKNKYIFKTKDTAVIKYYERRVRYCKIVFICFLIWSVLSFLINDLSFLLK